MKDKVIRLISIAVVTTISGALIAYLKNPENRAEVQKAAKKYQVKFKKSVKKVSKQFKSKVNELTA
jgi:hypothetical protein